MVSQFTNLTKDSNHLDRLETITNKFRRCPATAYALPATGHAAIRVFLECEETDTLMRMVNDRLNYGLFPDYYLSNLLMDTFLKKENYRGELGT